MAGLTDARHNAALDAALDGYDYVSLHTADGGTTGTSEASGGTPAYARKAITWQPAAGSSKVWVGSVTFDVPAGTYTHYGFWDDPTAGTWAGGEQLPSNQIFSSQGTLTINVTVVAERNAP